MSYCFLLHLLNRREKKAFCYIVKSDAIDKTRCLEGTRGVINTTNIVNEFMRNLVRTNSQVDRQETQVMVLRTLLLRLKQNPLKTEFCLESQTQIYMYI